MYLYGLIPPRIRYGNIFWETYGFLEKSQWWEKPQMEFYQLGQLNQLLTHAYAQVPYYREVFDERGLKPEDIKRLEDLEKLPFLTKEIIRERLPDLIALNFSKGEISALTTGGSTGFPLKFYRDEKKDKQREKAFIRMLWKRAGFNLSDTRIILCGIVPESAKNGKFWQYAPSENALILSSYHMDGATLPVYVEKIRRFKPDFIHCYPSSITLLGSFMKQSKISPFPTVRALLCGSESLYPAQRRFLEEVFQCRVFNFYGHSEHAVLGGECEESNYCHLFPEYGITELIDFEGKRIEGEDQKGEIVATGFGNYVMPFIRYKTNDLGTFAEQICHCGRKGPMVKQIDGRLQDFFVSVQGNYLPLTGVADRVISMTTNNIFKAQFYQDRPGCVVLKIVRMPHYSGSDSVKIMDMLTKRYGELLTFKIEFVEDIPRTLAGKHNFLIQKLPIKL